MWTALSAAVIEDKNVKDDSTQKVLYTAYTIKVTYTGAGKRGSIVSTVGLEHPFAASSASSSSSSSASSSAGEDTNSIEPGLADYGKHDVSWSIDRRYRDFAALYDNLHRRFQTAALPTLPPKTFFRNFEEKFISERRLELDTFVRELCKMPYAINTPVFQSFFETRAHCSGGRVVDATLVYALDEIPEIHKETPLPDKSGVKFAVFNSALISQSTESNPMLVTICGDNSSISKLDTYLAGFNFPWESDKNRAPPLFNGSLTAWSLVPNPQYKRLSVSATKEKKGDNPTMDKPFLPLKTHLVQFSHEVTAITVTSDLKTVFVGTSDGEIDMYAIQSYDAATKQLVPIPHEPDAQPAADAPADAGSGKQEEHQVEGGVPDKQEESVLKGFKLIRMLPKFHTQQITTLIVDELHNRLFSCGHDKVVSAYSLRDFVCLGQTADFAAWLTSMVYVPKTQRLYVASYGQTITECDCSLGYAPKIVKEYEAHAGSIRCLEFDPKGEQLFSGAFDSHICVWKISEQPIGEELPKIDSLRLVDKWQNASLDNKVTAMRWCASIYCLATGGDLGFISLWAADSSKVLFNWRAHSAHVTSLHWLPAFNWLVSTGLDGNTAIWHVDPAVYSAYSDAAAFDAEWVPQTNRPAPVASISTASSTNSSTSGSSIPALAPSRRDSNSSGPGRLSNTSTPAPAAGLTHQPLQPLFDGAMPVIAIDASPPVGAPIADLR